ncbi:hypothetical protein GWK08_11285 [Leptobacterium flavescens]|uniref:DUF4249 family protein n=1 Tax=Leptobacterium flavescens TaxID=472055 RepID=A0A6P0UUC2_9FLAO|nr:hypothetical protein [Leptobacterium flavescens]NER14026.1 hypothetical protein [Leptobacterium flavescens]
MRKKYIGSLFLLCAMLVFVSCNSEDNSSVFVDDGNLANLVANNQIEIDNVIACASGSDEDANQIIAYVYPREGVRDIRFYETENAEVDKDDYENYTQIDLPAEDFFNGYLKKFTRTTEEEKWIIISFFEGDVLQLSNPIRLKHKTIPTEFTDEVAIDSSVPSMPVFEWEDGAVEENAIYFQVVSTDEEDFLSGTYTFERNFQYYVLDNVVLNITTELPPALSAGVPYGFTLMGVSEDNWVNLFIQKSFIP